MEGAGRLAVNVGTVALLGFGGLLVLKGRISVGSLLAGGNLHRLGRVHTLAVGCKQQNRRRARIACSAG